MSDPGRSELRQFFGDRDWLLVTVSVLAIISLVLVIIIFGFMVAERVELGYGYDP